MDYIQDIAVLGNQLYLAEIHGLRIIDVADPAHPTELGYVAYEPNGVIGLEVAAVDAGRILALISNRAEKLDVLDVTDPLNIGMAPLPPSIASCPNGHLSFNGRYAYWLSRECGLLVLDRTALLNLPIVGRYAGIAYSHIAAVDDYIYISSRGLYVLKLKPEQP